jgi:hypothetical protein
MTGRQKTKPVLVAWLALTVAPHTAAGEPVNYCHDPQANQEWGELIEEAPGDDLLMRLFALRLGLCQLVGSGQLDLDRATSIFEQARAGALIERRRQEEQERQPDQRTGT